MQRVVYLGGTVSHKVNEGMRYLVSGTQEYVEGRSSKESAAEGLGIEIISEERSYSLIRLV